MDSDSLRKQLPQHIKTLQEIDAITNHTITQSRQICDQARRVQETTRHIITQSHQLLSESYALLRTQGVCLRDDICCSEHRPSTCSPPSCLW